MYDWIRGIFRCVYCTSSVQRLLTARYHIKYLRVINTFDDEIWEEDEGNFKILG